MKLRKTLSLFVSFSMLLATVVIPQTANAAKNYETTIIAASDFQHNDGDDYCVKTVNNITNQMKKDGFSAVDGFLFCGDYNQQYNQTEGSLKVLKDTISSIVPEEKNHVYVQGNHDAPIGTQGLSKSGNNDPESGKYGVFVIN